MNRTSNSGLKLVQKAGDGLLGEIGDTLSKTFLSTGNSQDLQNSLSQMKNILGILVIIGIVTLIIYFSYRRAKKEPLPASANVSLVIGNRVNRMKDEKELLGTKSFYQGLLPSIPANQRYLINFSPLTASLGGYIGDNVFYSSEYIQRALRAGVRSFILPISTYMDDNKRPPNWPLSGKPAIVCRNKEGKITSINALTIEKFSTELISFKANNPAQAEEPYILYIQQDKQFIPDPVKEEKEYVQLMANIGKELEKLKSFRLLNLGAYGSATSGGVNADKILLETPMDKLRNKILIVTNFDTRLQLKDSYKNITPRLHEYVNMIYKPNIVESINLSEALVSGSNYGDKTRVAWYVSNKGYFEDIPTREEVLNGLNAGVQGIPLPFFSVENAKLEEIHKLWNGYSMRPKLERIRFTKQPPIVPKAPNETLNARVEGSRNPGEIIVR